MPLSLLTRHRADKAWLTPAAADQTLLPGGRFDNDCDYAASGNFPVMKVGHSLLWKAANKRIWREQRSFNMS